MVTINESKIGLGSFKALGAVYAIAKIGLGNFNNKDNKTYFRSKEKLKGITFSASAGNHGLSLAAGAKLFGANPLFMYQKMF